MKTKKIYNKIQNKNHRDKVNKYFKDLLHNFQMKKT